MPLIAITEDLYDIAARLRSVEDSYRLFYNTDKCRYEVHARGALQFVVPYEEADARTVEYARMTRVERAKDLFAQIERDNARIVKEEK